MNCECNTCVYRCERDYLGSIMISCGYINKNKYDFRKLIDKHCNKYQPTNKFFDCTICSHYDSNCFDCRFITCVFSPIQLSLFCD